MPENSLACYQEALNQGVKAIEIDIWLTTDDELVVFHGGECGEFYDESSNPAGLGTKRAFDSTLEEVRASESKHRMPTLGEVFELAGDRMFVNIEVKCPYNPDVKKLYNWRRTAAVLFDLIKKYDYNENCYVSSFHDDFLLELLSVSEKHAYPVRTVLIGTWGEDKEPDMEYLTIMKHVGFNVRYSKATKELADGLRSVGKMLGVWFIKELMIEGEKEFQHLHEIGVDMICTDYPLEALKTLKEEKAIRKISLDTISTQDSS